MTFLSRFYRNQLYLDVKYGSTPCTQTLRELHSGTTLRKGDRKQSDLFFIRTFKDRESIFACMRVFTDILKSNAVIVEVQRRVRLTTNLRDWRWESRINFIDTQAPGELQ